MMFNARGGHFELSLQRFSRESLGGGLPEHAPLKSLADLRESTSGRDSCVVLIVSCKRRPTGGPILDFHEVRDCFEIKWEDL